MTGDFNINLLDATNANCKLIKIFRDVGLKQLINTATREDKNTYTLLDHLYTTHEDRISEIIVPVYGLSDHYPICFTHKFGRGKRSKNHHEEITYRNVIRQICVRDKLKARAKHSALARTMYKRTRNRVVKLITNAKSNYFKEKIIENKDNTRNLWKLLKQSAPIKPTSKAPTAILINGEHVTDPGKIADAFNEFFTSINTTTVLPDYGNLATSQSELHTLLTVIYRPHYKINFAFHLLPKKLLKQT